MYGYDAAADGRRVVYYWQQPGRGVAAIKMRDGRVYKVIGGGRSYTESEAAKVLEWDAREGSNRR